MTYSYVTHGNNQLVSFPHKADLMADDQLGSFT